ncbi:uncharacterized protein [Miscanthus floridulus]|uniref:uncharacterized protein n=1 Tax=Miscanthus floridulus TaxID=154761 RepID=UPI0034590418
MAQEVETEAGQALIPPSIQGPPPLQESAQEVEVHSISSDDTSRAKKVADAEAASTEEQPTLNSGKGSSVLVWSTKVEDLRLRCADMMAEAATAQEQAASLAARIKELEEELTWQKDLLANANKLLLAQSAEVEDLRLRCANMTAEVVMAQEQAAPLAAQIKELEEELT